MSGRYAIILADAPRARAYIQLLCAADCRPDEVLLMPGQWQSKRQFTDEERAGIGFNPDEPVQQTVKRYELAVTACANADMNSPETVAAVQRACCKVIVFGGPSGQILKPPVLNQGKCFLHAHPGWLPEFRGSTTIYYAILQQGQCGVSVIVFNEGIDTGAIVVRKAFAMPRRINVDLLYDPDIRAQAMVEAIRKLSKDGDLRTAIQTQVLPPYYVIHPVLKHVALLSADSWA